MPKIAFSEPATDTSASLPDVRNWAVAWTKPRCEHRVEEYLNRIQVPCFLPLVSKRHVYKTGVKNWTSPLFSGYLFFDADRAERHTLFDSRKVVDILCPPDPGALGRELGQIALALERDSTLRETRFGQKGRRVVVNRGPMKGLHGELVRIGSNSHLILRVDFLGKAAELMIDESCVEPELG